MQGVSEQGADGPEAMLESGFTGQMQRRRVAQMHGGQGV